MPDDELFSLAQTNQLRAHQEEQVRRMLKDRKARALTENFAAQWLHLGGLKKAAPDPKLFPDFDEKLRQDMREETRRFVTRIIAEDRSIMEFLNADYTFLNERLAKHYGIPHIYGTHFRRVALQRDSERGGLLRQASLLTVTSYATRTSPVLRGKWVLENLLSAAPPPPPPNIPALKTEGKQPGETLSMREAMTRHRADPACASCHARMDPIGFAMENFDAIGRWRDADGGNAIDASGQFPDGVKFEGIAGLKKVLLEHPGQFVDTVAGKLLMYSVGRNLQYYDAPSVRAIVRDAARDNYTFASLILGIVKSTPFQMREAQ
jgi:hypothetical protein